MENSIEYPQSIQRSGKSRPRLGRPPGATNKTTRLFKQVISETFSELQKDPATSMITWARKHPAEFYRFARKVIPGRLKEAVPEISERHLPNLNSLS